MEPKRKPLKFKPHLVRLILEESKTSTWRLFDDKNLTKGDRLDLINSDTGQKFAQAEIIDLKEKPLSEITATDNQGHKEYSNTNALISHFREYYGEGVTSGSLFKIIEFKLLRRSNGK